jgi:hypothetical protein
VFGCTAAQSRGLASVRTQAEPRPARKKVKKACWQTTPTDATSKSPARSEKNIRPRALNTCQMRGLLKRLGNTHKHELMIEARMQNTAHRRARWRCIPERKIKSKRTELKQLPDISKEQQGHAVACEHWPCQNRWLRFRISINKHCTTSHGIANGISGQ